jgi:hypothetical protein
MWIEGMSRLIRIHVAFYELLLPVFPPDLRMAFGDAMVQTFEEQLEGLSAVSVWMDVGRDLMRVALPYRAAGAIVPMVTLIGSSALFYLVLWGISPDRHC